MVWSSKKSPIYAAIVSDDTSPTGFATKSVQTTTSASALPDTPCKGALVQASVENNEPVMIGDENSQDWELTPGTQLPLTATNLNQIYILSQNGGQTVNVVYST